ncbi:MULTISPECIES: hypothetical protein [Ruegeria]|uniref:hypothetical protein n=1 Tax=Ruegeria TaxID=97050 RepID=UPI00147D5E4C|nr:MULTISPECIES: hypothetical protein [Ruegeria]
MSRQNLKRHKPLLHFSAYLEPALDQGSNRPRTVGDFGAALDVIRIGKLRSVSVSIKKGAKHNDLEACNGGGNLHWSVSLWKN